MEVEFLRRFSKDIDDLRSTDLKKKIAKIIVPVEGAERISAIHNIKKLRGHSYTYRIGLFIEGDIVKFARVVHRKEIYRVFP